MRIRAILPAAGRGTRMASITGGAAKELLMLDGRSVLSRVIDEARFAGASEVVVISSPAKPMVTEEAIRCGAEVVLQDSPKGLGDAILAGWDPDAAGLVLLPDTLFLPEAPTRSLVVGEGFSVLAESVEPELQGRYGIIEVADGLIQRIIEKPAPGESDSLTAISARVFVSQSASRSFFDFLSESVAEVDQVSWSPALSSLCLAGHLGRAISLPTGTTRCDCGAPEGYRLAQEMMG